jgi:hypothetical protein
METGVRSVAVDKHTSTKQTHIETGIPKQTDPFQKKFFISN